MTSFRPQKFLVWMKTSQLPVQAQNQGHRSAARRQASSRAKSALPLSPRKYVETVADLMNAATPRKRVIFEDAGTIVASAA